ncbi:hypothetical protein PCL1606_51540 [Pseudomonas chlororaphis]|uniref:Uncharacterized protein n=1 Tax=Pseudomonas chlororaphis TaxID=587753 RepID=A0A0D5Y5M0_9PSED|nr:hypothetical protein PCL1606_51540 [Pseudomonas chlororaphis]
MHGNGDAYVWRSTGNSGVKVSANRALSAPTAGEGTTYFFLALAWVQDPGAGLPGRLVAQVLGMATGQLGDPVTVFILMEAGDRRAGRGVPFVRVPFAFGRLLR